MKISIAMTTYNGERHIEAQLKSILEQTEMPDEVVICDDGSIDGTLGHVDAFSRNAPFDVNVIRNTDNLGLNKNNEKAIGLCTSEIILLCDQDDVWYPDKIEAVKKLFKANPDLMVLVNDADIVDEQGSKSKLTKQVQIKNLGLLPDTMVTGCCTSFRKEIVPVILPIPAFSSSHDSWIHFISSRLFCRKVVSDVLQMYRRHGSNLSDSLSSGVNKVGKVDLLLHLIKNGYPDAKLHRLIKQMQESELRLQNNSKYLVETIGMTAEQVSKLQTRLSDEGCELVKRNLLREKSGIYKIWGILIYRFSGGYIYGDGWKDAVKDIFSAAGQ
jgi:glycosyltransferase involved in cell wall biosynthesis